MPSGSHDSPPIRAIYASAARKIRHRDEKKARQLGCLRGRHETQTRMLGFTGRSDWCRALHTRMRRRFCSTTTRNYSTTICNNSERLSADPHGEPRSDASLHRFSDRHDKYSGDVEPPGRGGRRRNNERRRLYSAINRRNLSRCGDQPSRPNEERDGKCCSSPRFCIRQSNVGYAGPDWLARFHSERQWND